MRVEVELFGRTASQSGVNRLEVELPPGASLRDVADAVIRRHPVLDWMTGVCRPARNLEYARWEDPVEEGDRVSFIPPVSGGRPEDPVWVALTTEPLTLDPLLRFVEDPAFGAVVTFAGNVREENRGRRVGHLEYEAYVPMAEKELIAIAREAVERWRGRVAVHHRLGRLEIGEPSVLIAAACAHRADAFESCRSVIEALKVRVPIWKREVWDDGEVWIEGPADAPVR